VEFNFNCYGIRDLIKSVLLNYEHTFHVAVLNIIHEFNGIVTSSLLLKGHK
jgi:hypothetical protein